MRVVASRTLRFEGAARHATGRLAWDRRAGLLLRLVDEDGRVGQGEASPLPGYSPDDIDACERALAAVHERLADVGEDDAGAAIAAERALAPAVRALGLVPAATFAIETALLDLAGQRSGQSVSALLRGAPLPAGATVPLAGLAGAALDPELESSARAIAARGIAALKVKVGAAGAFERELAALESLRAELGDAVALRLDANGAWDLEQARRHLARLAPLGPAWIEEPCAGAALAELGRAAIGWAADESLARSPDLAARLIEAPGCVAVVLKPALLGLSAARRLALAAGAQGRAVVITHLFDGPVALAAAAELLLSLPSAAAAGLNRHAGLGAWPRADVPQIAPGGASVAPSGRAGLGLAPIAPEPPTEGAP